MAVLARQPTRLDGDGRPVFWELQPLWALSIDLGGGQPPSFISRYSLPSFWRPTTGPLWGMRKRTPVEVHDSSCHVTLTHSAAGIRHARRQRSQLRQLWTAFLYVFFFFFFF